MTGTPDELDEIVGEFLVESHENLDRLDQQLVELEQQPDPDTIASIFRTIHTIKGTSGFLGYGTLERVTHVGESLLSKLRDGDLAVTAEITSALLAMVDAVRQILADIEHQGTEGPESFDALVGALERLDAGERTEASSTLPTPSAGAGDPAIVDAPAAPPAEGVQVFGDLLVTEGRATEQEVALAVAAQQAGDPRHLGELLVEQGTIEPQEVVEALQHQQEQRASQSAAGPSVSESSIRVDVGLLDKLMNLVGELVLARNQILQFTQTVDGGGAGLTGTSQRLNLITTELQEGVMKTRMQPIEQRVEQVPPRRARPRRGLRQAGAHRDGGQGHRARQDDHRGDQGPADPPRAQLGRPRHRGARSDGPSAASRPRGVLRLRAFHEGGQVNIEISDDGAGIDTESDPGQGRRTRPHHRRAGRPDGRPRAHQPDLPAGLLHGRDRVRTSRVAASAWTSSRRTSRRSAAASTCSRAKARAPLQDQDPADAGHHPGPDRHLRRASATPSRRSASSSSSASTVGRSASSVEHIHGTPVYRLRGRLLPLVFLDEILRTARADDPESESINIVVLQADDQQFGLVVAEINDTAEIVVKPLSRLLKGVRAFAGATIMGDGRIALILDVLGLAEMASVNGHHRDRSHGDGDGDDAADRRTMLLFSLGERRLALLLEMVARLEEFDAATIEQAGDQRVVQYRGQILPLVFLADELGYPSERDPDGPLRVVVYTEGQCSVGLVVDGIHDIVEQSIELSTHTAVAGTLGSAVIQGRVTDVLDVEGVLRAALAQLFTEVAA